MSSRVFTLLGSFKARLSRQIACWIFASIVAIEIIILIPSYYRRERELLGQLEEVSGVVINAIVRLTREDMSDMALMAKVSKITSNSAILGVAIYSSDGKRIGTCGEPPEITFSDLRGVDVLRRWKGNRYDVARSPRYLNADYTLIVRHDGTAIKQELYDFTVRIAGLVLLISVFVTSVTMVVLGVTAIVPILRLRDDLIAAGEALSQDKNTPDFYSLSVRRSDELGEVMDAFKQMFCRVDREIAERKQAEETLRAEREKSERLLLNILPAAIAEQLKQGRSKIADGFDEVTILFADIVNFTQLSEKISPAELLELLNEIFSAFDELTDRHKLEKIKTIGDAYMVAGGLPEPRKDHAEAIAEMALDMQQEINRFNLKHGTELNLRIGINTGPAIAGAIGTKKFIYDLWGDAVNTASRMESHGIPGYIQVTESTYDLLRGKYLFEERGMIQVKGKGEMMTYLLAGRKTEGV